MALGLRVMTEENKTRDLNAREAVEGIRGPLTNAQLLEKFKITPAGFADLLRQLFIHKLVTKEDLRRRGAKFKIVRNEPQVQPPKLLSPPPNEMDYGFLDTVALTEMLTFKLPESDVPAKKVTEEPVPKTSDNESTTEKKGRLSLGGLFKKGR